MLVSSSLSTHNRDTPSETCPRVFPQSRTTVPRLTPDLFIWVFFSPQPRVRMGIVLHLLQITALLREQGYGEPLRPELCSVVLIHDGLSPKLPKTDRKRDADSCVCLPQAGRKVKGEQNT